MTEIQWTLYPYVAELDHAKDWLVIQKKLLRASKTIDAYARGLNDFLSVCERSAFRVESATKGDIASYVEEMASRPQAEVQGSRHKYGTVGLANKTMQQRLTAVRLFYDYLMEIGIRDSNPVGRGRYTPGTGFNGLRERGLIRRFEKQPWIPGDREWEAFLNALVREEFLRNQVMAFVSYDGALRRSELVSLELSDIDFSHRKITIRSETTKNRAGRIVFYSDATSDLLCLYVRHRQGILKTHLKTSPRALFVSESRRNRGEPLTCEMWNKSVQKVARRAGLPEFTTHTFRHLRLTDLARCKLELHEIAMYAGHRSLKSTHQYIQLSSVELEERVRLATKHLDERNKRMLERVTASR
jgi:site-specific recombinase XerD